MIKGALVLLLTFTGCSAWVLSEKTVINEDIDPALRRTLSKIENKLFASLREKDEEGFTSLLSKNLLGLEDFDSAQFLDQIQPYVREYEFKKLYEYYTTAKGMKSGNRVTLTIDPPGQKNRFIIKNINIEGNECYNLFYTSVNEEGFQLLFYAGLSKFENQWKINLIHIGDYSFEGATAQDYYEKAVALKDEGKTLPAAVYALIMNKLQYPGSLLQYENDKKYNDFFNDIIKDVNEKMAFPIELNAIEFYNMNILLTREHGYIPLITYVTDTPLEKEALKDELDTHRDEIELHLGDLGAYFDRIIMQGVNERPDDVQKQYDMYRTTFYLNTP